jgi:hypothetical protein
MSQGSNPGHAKVPENQGKIAAADGTVDPVVAGSSPVALAVSLVSAHIRNKSQTTTIVRVI